ncbi:unnamed protein product [Peniophora sp. CBMAI 1063]|nr:unnamed protein product [Peniophora sp. CBMAI 1063]
MIPLTRRPEVAPDPEPEPAELPTDDLTKTLPVELLSAIFHISRDIDPARLIDAPKNSSEQAICRGSRINAELSPSWRLRGWFAVTHVCARWRTLALARPTLWAIVYLNLGPSWVDTFIARSDPVPFIFLTEARKGQFSYSGAPGGLDIIQAVIDSSQRTFDKVLSEHASRLLQLDINDSLLTSDILGLRPIEALPKKIFQRLPALQTLVLHGYDMSIESQPWESFDVPCLQKLILSGIKSFPWEMPSLAGLSCLVVKGSIGARGNNFQWSRLRDALSRISELEQLHLELMPISIYDEITKDKVTLPRLRRLGLRDQAHCLKFLLRIIDAPALRGMDISQCVAFGGTDTPHFDQILSASLMYLPSESLTDLSIAIGHRRTSMRVCQSTLDVGLIYLSQSDGYDHIGQEALVRGLDATEPYKPLLSLDDSLPASNSYVLNLSVTGAIRVPLPLSGVNTLRFDGILSAQEIHDAFHTMLSVKHIRVYSHASLPGMFSALAITTPTMLFPALESIAFAYGDAASRQWISSGSVEGFESSPHLELCNLVRARATSGRPFRCLYFPRSESVISAFEAYASEAGQKCPDVVELIKEDQVK